VRREGVSVDDVITAFVMPPPPPPPPASARESQEREEEGPEEGPEEGSEEETEQQEEGGRSMSTTSMSGSARTAAREPCSRGVAWRRSSVRARR
jgi:ribosomal protein L12E/L44/L45/RPP1/RPP2